MAYTDKKTRKNKREKFITVAEFGGKKQRKELK